MRNKIISIKLDQESKDIIEKAANYQDLPIATYSRIVLIKEARKIQQEASNSV